MRIRFFKYNYYRQIVLYLLLILFSLFIYAELRDNVISRAILWIVIVGAIIISLSYQYFSYIYIYNKGILFKSLFKNYILTWDKIGQIKIIRRWQGRIIWIIILTSTDLKDLSAKKNAFNRREKCITFAYNKKATDAISLYWKEDMYDAYFR